MTLNSDIFLTCSSVNLESIGTKLNLNRSTAAFALSLTIENTDFCFNSSSLIFSALVPSKYFLKGVSTLSFNFPLSKVTISVFLAIDSALGLSSPTNFFLNPRILSLNLFFIVYIKESFSICLSFKSLPFSPIKYLLKGFITLNVNDSFTIPKNPSLFTY